MRPSRVSECLLLLLVVILLSHSVLADFVVRDNQTINRGNRDGYKNASFYCWNDGTCQTTAATGGGGGSSYNDTNLSLRVTNLETNASSTNARLAQINTSANILTHAYAAGMNKTTELFTYFSALFLGINDQRYNETGRVDALNSSKLDASDQRYNESSRISDLNSSKLDTTDQRYNETQRVTDLNSSATSNASSQQTQIDSKINSSQDQNNYTIACSVSGTTTKTAMCSRSGSTNVSFSWTDIDTDTDTNNGGTSNVTNVISGNVYIIATGNSTHFNLTLNVTAVNGSWNDTPLIQALNTSLLSLISAKVGNGTDINASRLRVNGVDVCLSNGTNCPSSAVDQNNYTTSIDVTGTSTKTINLVRNDAPNINATFTDIDTDTDTQGNTTFGNGTATYRVDSGKTVRILPGRNVSSVEIANDTSGNLNLTINVVDTDTDTFNTTAQMQLATNNTLNALRVACGNITGASSNLCTLTDTDTNSGGTSNISTIVTGNTYLIAGPNNATQLNVTANSTALNASFNDTPLINQVNLTTDTAWRANASAQQTKIDTTNVSVQNLNSAVSQVNTSSNIQSLIRPFANVTSTSNGSTNRIAVLTNVSNVQQTAWNINDTLINIPGAGVGAIWVGVMALVSNANTGRVATSGSALTFAVSCSLNATTCSSDRMTLSTNGLYIGSSGTTPNSRLNVEGATNITSNLTVDGTTFRIDATNDKVGIGTNNPAAKLDVVGDLNATGKATIGADVYAYNDSYGLYNRLVYYGFSPDETWNNGTDGIPWTGYASYPNFITPTLESYTVSAYQTSQATVNRTFRYRSADTSNNIVLRTRVGITFQYYAGLMIDDGNTTGCSDGNGSRNFYRAYINQTSLGGPITAVEEYRVECGTVTTNIGPVMPYGQYTGLDIACTGTRWTSWTCTPATFGESQARIQYTGGSFAFNWTPVRVGLYGRQTAIDHGRRAIFDWYDEASS